MWYFRPLIFFFFFFFLFEIIQTEDIGNEEVGSGKTRLTILALIT